MSSCFCATTRPDLSTSRTSTWAAGGIWRPMAFFIEPETKRRSSVSKARVLAISPPVESMVSTGRGELACLKKLPAEAHDAIATAVVPKSASFGSREINADIFIWLLRLMRSGSHRLRIAPRRVHDVFRTRTDFRVGNSDDSMLRTAG